MQVLVYLRLPEPPDRREKVKPETFRGFTPPWRPRFHPSRKTECRRPNTLPGKARQNDRGRKPRFVREAQGFRTLESSTAALPVAQPSA